MEQLGCLVLVLVSSVLSVEVVLELCDQLQVEVLVEEKEKMR